MALDDQPPVTVRLPLRSGERSYGRNVELDPRSRAYAWAPRRKRPEDYPEVIWHPRGRTLDQNGIGACVGFAAAYWLQTHSAKFQPSRVTNSVGKDLYSRATRRDPWPGAWPPDDTGTSGLAVAKVLRTLGYIRGYSHAFTTLALVDALQHSSVLVGASWRTGMERVDDHGYIHATGDVLGGHETIWCGWLPHECAFLCRMAWGPFGFEVAGDDGTGYDGFFKVSLDDWDRVLRPDQADVIILRP